MEEQAPIRDFGVVTVVSVKAQRERNKVLCVHIAFEPGRWTYWSLKKQWDTALA
jgi:hypothetical protein